MKSRYVLYYFFMVGFYSGVMFFFCVTYRAFSNIQNASRHHDEKRLITEFPTDSKTGNISRKNDPSKVNDILGSHKNYLEVIPAEVYRGDILMKLDIEVAPAAIENHKERKTDVKNLFAQFGFAKKSTTSKTYMKLHTTAEDLLVRLGFKELPMGTDNHKERITDLDILSVIGLRGISAARETYPKVATTLFGSFDGEKAKETATATVNRKKKITNLGDLHPVFDLKEKPKTSGIYAETIAPSRSIFEMSDFKEVSITNKKSSSYDLIVSLDSFQLPSANTQSKHKEVITYLDSSATSGERGTADEYSKKTTNSDDSAGILGFEKIPKGIKNHAETNTTRIIKGIDFETRPTTTENYTDTTTLDRST